MLGEALSVKYLDNLPTTFGKFVRDENDEIIMLVQEDFQAGQYTHKEIATSHSVKDPKDAGQFQWTQHPPELVFWDHSGSLNVGKKPQERINTKTIAERTLSLRRDQVDIKALPYPRRPQ